ncbi:MAG TPA: hypothetical protein GX707_13095 [Epulopiscium sp.]|nr:hypothetical protein [Candidatus Epulonipiscium sp.]
MDDIVSREDTYVDLKSPILAEISPYDSAYPIMLLSNGLKNRLAEAQVMADEVYKTVVREAPELAQVHKSLKKGYRYVVDATDSTLEAIDSGGIKLVTDKSGNMFSQIRKANGHFGSKIPIKKENFREGINPVQMANALQMKALQVQIQQISDQISVIGQSIKEVLQGQQNDRIGLYYSGMALYLESRSVINKELKKALMAQSLRALSESTFQLTLTMQSDIQYLANERYKVEKGKSVELIDNRMSSITQSFAFIHQATMLRAGIYCNEGELAAMSTVLDEYSHLIEGTVARNAALLAQCDTTDDGTEEGVWKSKTRLKLDVSDLAKQLNMPEKTVYIKISKEDEK